MFINLLGNNNYNDFHFSDGKIYFLFYFSDDDVVIRHVLKQLYILKQELKEGNRECDLAILLKTKRNFDPGMLLLPFRFNYTLSATNQYFILSLRGDDKWTWSFRGHQHQHELNILNNGTLVFNFETNTIYNNGFKLCNADSVIQEKIKIVDAQKFLAFESKYKTTDFFNICYDESIDCSDHVLFIDATLFLNDKMNLVFNTIPYLNKKFDGRITSIIYLNNNLQAPIPRTPYRLVRNNEKKILIFLGENSSVNGVFLTNVFSHGLLEIPDTFSIPQKTNYKLFSENIFCDRNIPHAFFSKLSYFE